MRIAVNLFSAQLQEGNLVNTVLRALGDTGIAPELLELEITENIILRNDETIRGTLSELRDFGVHIAFDDYGTGYASLSMLKQYPVTRLKIDKGFVQNMESDKGDIAIIDAVVQLGRSFGLDVIAEGVESDIQERILRSLGCKQAQGFLYGRAMPASELEALIASSAEERVEMQARKSA